MSQEVTRYISNPKQRELWARSAGRCQFSGCNRLLYKSSITQEAVNLAQKAHIYSFSETGPRGWGKFITNKKALNDLNNLMLMCHECHKKIDENPKKYPADLLVNWKKSHEYRIETVTSIDPRKNSHVVLYGANIGAENSPIVYSNCVQAMFPDWYPANERPIELSMTSELRDNSAKYWAAEGENLFKSYERKIVPLIERDDCKHFSIFSLAPQPLLIRLGTLLTDKVSVETYQLHREPKGWSWLDVELGSFDFVINTPSSTRGFPVLVLALSDHVSENRITDVIDKNVSIWEITIKSPNNSFLKSKKQLSLFRGHIRQLMVDIKKEHGNNEPLHIFPVMPISCAVELGRARMPKADMPWVIYDQNYKDKKFVKSLEIGSA